MPDPIVTQITVEAGSEFMRQIIKYEYSEHSRIGKAVTYQGEWTEEEAEQFRKDKYAEIYDEVQADAQVELDRVERMRLEMLGIDPDDIE